MLVQRRNVINEVIQTERGFCEDMDLLLEVRFVPFDYRSLHPFLILSKGIRKTIGEARSFVCYRNQTFVFKYFGACRNEQENGDKVRRKKRRNAIA